MIQISLCSLTSLSADIGETMPGDAGTFLIPRLLVFTWELFFAAVRVFNDFNSVVNGKTQCCPGGRKMAGSEVGRAGS